MTAGSRTDAGRASGGRPYGYEDMPSGSVNGNYCVGVPNAGVGRLYGYDEERWQLWEENGCWTPLRVGRYAERQCGGNCCVGRPNAGVGRLCGCDEERWQLGGERMLGGRPLDAPTGMKICQAAVGGNCCVGIPNAGVGCSYGCDEERWLLGGERTLGGRPQDAPTGVI